MNESDAQQQFGNVLRRREQYSSIVLSRARQQWICYYSTLLTLGRRTLWACPVLDIIFWRCLHQETRYHVFHSQTIESTNTLEMKNGSEFTLFVFIVDNVNFNIMYKLPYKKAQAQAVPGTMVNK